MNQRPELPEDPDFPLTAEDMSLMRLARNQTLPEPSLQLDQRILTFAAQSVNASRPLWLWALAAVLLISLPTLVLVQRVDWFSSPSEQQAAPVAPQSKPVVSAVAPQAAVDAKLDQQESAAVAKATRSDVLINAAKKLAVAERAEPQLANQAAQQDHKNKEAAPTTTPNSLELLGQLAGTGAKQVARQNPSATVSEPKGFARQSSAGKVSEREGLVRPNSPATFSKLQDVAQAHAADRMPEFKDVAHPNSAVAITELAGPVRQNLAEESKAVAGQNSAVMLPEPQPNVELSASSSSSPESQASSDLAEPLAAAPSLAASANTSVLSKKEVDVAKPVVINQPPSLWLNEIQALIDQARVADAVRQLSEFDKTYPNYHKPKKLQDWWLRHQPKPPVKP